MWPAAAQRRFAAASASMARLGRPFAPRRRQQCLAHFCAKTFPLFEKALIPPRPSSIAAHARCYAAAGSKPSDWPYWGPPPSVRTTQPTEPGPKGRGGQGAEGRGKRDKSKFTPNAKLSKVYNKAITAAFAAVSRQGLDSGAARVTEVLSDFAKKGTRLTLVNVGTIFHRAGATGLQLPKFALRYLNEQLQVSSELASAVVLSHILYGLRSQTASKHSTRTLEEVAVRLERLSSSQRAQTRLNADQLSKALFGLQNFGSCGSLHRLLRALRRHQSTLGDDAQQGDDELDTNERDFDTEIVLAADPRRALEAIVNAASSNGASGVSSSVEVGSNLPMSSADVAAAARIAAEDTDAFTGIRSGMALFGLQGAASSHAAVQAAVAAFAVRLHQAPLDSFNFRGFLYALRGINGLIGRPCEVRSGSLWLLSRKLRTWFYFIGAAEDRNLADGEVGVGASTPLFLKSIVDRHALDVAPPLVAVDDAVEFLWELRRLPFYEAVEGLRDEFDDVTTVDVTRDAHLNNDALFELLEYGIASLELAITDNTQARADSATAATVTAPEPASALSTDHAFEVCCTMLCRFWICHM